MLCLKAYVATGNHRKAWDEAVQEAEDSFKYSDAEARVVHMRKLLECSLTVRKRKLNHDGESPEGQKKKRRRKGHFTHDLHIFFLFCGDLFALFFIC